MSLGTGSDSLEPYTVRTERAHRTYVHAVQSLSYTDLEPKYSRLFVFCFASLSLFLCVAILTFVAC